MQCVLARCLASYDNFCRRLDVLGRQSSKVLLHGHNGGTPQTGMRLTQCATTLPKKSEQDQARGLTKDTCEGQGATPFPLFVV